jgi:syntaxin 1B/2/3
LYEASLSSVRDDAKGHNDVQVQIADVTLENTILVQRISKEIKTLETNNQMERVQRDKVVHAFMHALVEYQAVQSRYRKRYQDRLERQYRVIHPTASQSDIQQMLDGETGNVFAQHLTSSSLRGSARRALKEAQDQHKEILQLEESILDLHHLFVEMTTLVEQQQTQLETVGTYVEEAEEKLEAGVQELSQGVELSKRGRRKRYILGAVFTLLLIVVAIMVYFFVQPNGTLARPSNNGP